MIYRQLIKFRSKFKPTLNEFLTQYFNLKEHKNIVQIGANDGIQNDPLYNFFLKKGNYSATLVEPIPYYYDKLIDLYKERDEIKIIRTACGPIEGEKKLYFIPPEIANQMNGDGPQNDWAHGQGSFDINNVKYWIRANSFRGENYKKNISNYINSIISISTPIIQTQKVLPNNENLLIVIDVQGFEIDVLNGVDWAKAPKWIVLEDDLNKTKEILNYMKSKGFSWVAGKNDKVFQKMT